MKITVGSDCFKDIENFKKYIEQDAKVSLKFAYLPITYLKLKVSKCPSNRGVSTRNHLKKCYYKIVFNTESFSVISSVANYPLSNIDIKTRNS